MSHIWLITVVLIGATFAQSAVSNVSALAQDVAEAACPFAMLRSYGCPNGMSSSRMSNVGTCRSSRGSCGEAMPNVNDEVRWPIGSVPVGLGFDAVNVEVRLPFYYPEGEQDYVFSSSITTETISSIQDYVGTLDPTALQSLLTGTLSTDVAQMASTYFGSYYSMQRTTQVDIIRHATLTATPTILPQVQRALRFLPETYDYATYSEFIHYWGTHVITAAAIGGACEQLLTVRSCFSSGDAMSLEQYAQLDLAISTEQDTTGSQLSQQFLTYTKTSTLSFFGGDPSLFEPSQWPQRQTSIAESPVLISVEAMVPIASLVEGNPTVQQNLQQAVATYIANAVSARNAAMAAAIASKQYSVQAVFGVQFNDFTTTFGYQQQYGACCGWSIFGWCTNSCNKCRGETACMTPGGTCSTSCPPPVASANGMVVVPETPTATISATQSATMSTQGEGTCLCGSYPGFGTPSFPMNNLASSVTCSVNAEGQVQATGLSNPSWSGRGSVTASDGTWVSSGCSIASIVYENVGWTVSGGNQGCGTTTGPLNGQGNFVAYGYCCMDTTVEVVVSNGCYGSILQTDCPATPQ